MIKVSKGCLEIEGKKSLVKTELVVLIHIILEKEILSKNEIQECIKIGLKTEEEVNRELKELFNKKKINKKRIEKEFDEFLKELFN